MRAGEERIAGLGEDFDGTLRRQRVGPHENWLARLPREFLEFRQIGFEKDRTARCDHHNDAVNRRRTDDQSRELGITQFLHPLSSRIDGILGRGVGRQMDVERGARLFV